MLTNRYMQSAKNVAAIFQKIVDGTAPTKFTKAHLLSLGFKSSNDLGILGLLKDLGFLTLEGSPTPRYHAYRDKSRSKAVMAAALRDAYGDLFHINEKPTSADRPALEGKFKTTHNATDRVAQEQVRTFLSLLALADLTASAENSPQIPDAGSDGEEKKAAGKEKDKDATGNLPKEREKQEPSSTHGIPVIAGLRYNIEIHLPATKDIEVFNAIFKSLKEHLLED